MTTLEYGKKYNGKTLEFILENDKKYWKQLVVLSKKETSLKSIKEEIKKMNDEYKLLLSTKLNFGTHSNKTYKYVLKNEIQYCKWILDYVNEKEGDACNFKKFLQGQNILESVVTENRNTDTEDLIKRLENLDKIKFVNEIPFELHNYDKSMLKNPNVQLPLFKKFIELAIKYYFNKTFSDEKVDKLLNVNTKSIFQDLNIFKSNSGEITKAYISLKNEESKSIIRDLLLCATAYYKESIKDDFTLNKKIKRVIEMFLNENIKNKIILDANLDYGFIKNKVQIISNEELINISYKESAQDILSILISSLLYNIRNKKEMETSIFNPLNGYKIILKPTNEHMLYLLNQLKNLKLVDEKEEIILREKEFYPTKLVFIKVNYDIITIYNEEIENNLEEENNSYKKITSIILTSTELLKDSLVIKEKKSIEVENIKSIIPLLKNANELIFFEEDESNLLFKLKEIKNLKDKKKTFMRNDEINSISFAYKKYFNKKLSDFIKERNLNGESKEETELTATIRCYVKSFRIDKISKELILEEISNEIIYSEDEYNFNVIKDEEEIVIKKEIIKDKIYKDNYNDCSNYNYTSKESKESSDSDDDILVF